MDSSPQENKSSLFCPPDGSIHNFIVPPFIIAFCFQISRADIHKMTPFCCQCVCEVWVFVIQTLDHLSSQFNIEVNM